MGIYRIIVVIIILTHSSINQSKSLDLERIPSMEAVEVIELLGESLPLEEDEIVLDYRYTEKDRIEVFSQIGESYYRKFYLLKDDKIEMESKEEIELGKTGLKTKE